MRKKLTDKEKADLEKVLKQQRRQLKQVNKLKADIEKEIKEVEDILKNGMPILPISALLHMKSAPPQEGGE